MTGFDVSSRNREIDDVRMGVLMRFVVGLLLCVASVTPVSGKGQSAAEASRGRASQTDVNGFKVGDTVEVDTAFGWVDAQIIAIVGNNYRVQLSTGVSAVKAYPAELHRKGPFTARDHELGLYDLKDRVQVNVQGQGWIDGVVITRRALEYEVRLPGNRSVWASGPNARYVGAPASTTKANAGGPPKPGYTACTGKLEGRWAPSSGFGGLAIEIRAGKATVAAAVGPDQLLECWTTGDKIILRDPAHPEQDMPIEINKDGTLQTPVGELKKKGDDVRLRESVPRRSRNDSRIN
jgi:hypothetical protein